MKSSADNHHRMRPHNIDHCIPAEHTKVIRANNYVVVPVPNSIHTRFKFNDVLQPGLVRANPIHPAHDATERKASRRISRRELFKSLKHPVLIEFAVAKISVGVGFDLQLPPLLSGGRVDTRDRQSAQMLLLLMGIDDLNGLIAALQAISDERKQHAILFIVAGEKCADMTDVA